MTRPILKLPAKPNVQGDADDTRSAFRKPIRGGSKSGKSSAAQRARAIANQSARTSGEAGQSFNADDKPRAASRFKPAAPVVPAGGVPPESARATIPENDAPQPRAVRAPQPPKAYPKRGIARSTGARALPPTRATRTDNEHDGLRPEPVRIEIETRSTTGWPARPRHQDTPPAPPTGATTPPRRPLNEPPRLAKRISEMAQCSRREADEWIENGWVRVDGVVVTTLGTRAHPNAKIEIREEASKHESESVTILLNKPLDTTSGQEEGDGNAVMHLICPENRWEEDESRFTFKATHLRGLAQAGKLDAESTGMLVFTQEGSVARRISGDDTRLEKEYMVRVEGELSPEGMKLLNHGLALDEVKLKRAQVSWQNEQQLRFVLHESKKRQIQRMCELVGLRVTSIKRIRIGSVSLGKLPAGQWRYLRQNERF